MYDIVSPLDGILSPFGARRGFNPSTLFALGEPGAWYDPSDLSTMFQDTAGTMPITAAGQSVARINDKSGRGNHATQTTAGARPTYQVDATGRGFLLFDGADDWLVTPTITPGTDKAQVFAGVRKLSDAATGVLVETSATADNNAGGFYLANLSSGAWQPQTGPAAARTYTPYFLGAAPRTSVLATVLDNAVIGAGEVSLRENGQVRTGTAIVVGDGASGNFLAYPLYIGRRGGTSLPFNGRIYGLIVRFGANLTADQIARVETWMNGKTGAY